MPDSGFPSHSATGDGRAPKPASDETLRRAKALDAVLPYHRRDFLAGLLSDDDVETLRHLANEGIGENSLRALTSDLGYLEAWCLAATGSIRSRARHWIKVVPSGSIAGLARDGNLIDERVAAVRSSSTITMPAMTGAVKE